MWASPTQSKASAILPGADVPVFALPRLRGKRRREMARRTIAYGPLHGSDVIEIVAPQDTESPTRIMHDDWYEQGLPGSGSPIAR